MVGDGAAVSASAGAGVDEEETDEGARRIERQRAFIQKTNAMMKASAMMRSRRESSSSSGGGGSRNSGSSKGRSSRFLWALHPAFSVTSMMNSGSNGAEPWWPLEDGIAHQADVLGKQEAPPQ